MFFNKSKEDAEFYKNELFKSQDELNRIKGREHQSRVTKLDDIYQNFKTGQGTIQDSNEYSVLKQFTVYSFQTLENLAACDPIISKILQIIVRAIYQNKFEIICEDENYFNKFYKLWKKYGLNELMYDGSRSGYVHGHSFLVLNLDDSNDDSVPLDITKVKNIRGIDMANRYFFAPEPVERNFKFDPIYYYLVQQPIYDGFDLHNDEDMVKFRNYIQKLSREKIHYTRMLPFWGSKLDPYLFRSNLHFHDTYIRKIEWASKNYHIAMGNLATLMSKVPYAIAKIENLYNNLSTPDQRSKLATSMKFREQQRSTNNVSVMDTKEEYQLYSPSLAGFAEAHETIKKRLCDQSDIPHDLLFGEGSTGQTTGRTEKTNFERFIAAERELKVEPKIEFFMELFQYTDGLKKPNDYEIVFEHTEQPTELESSQSFKNNADAVNILSENGFDCTSFVQSKYPNITRDFKFNDAELILP